MFGRQPWMYRGHEDYDPNEIGTITESHAICALLEAGFQVYLPHLRVSRCDLVIEDMQGRFFRVQCKTGMLTHGAVFFRPISLRAAKKETGWRRIAANYQGDIEYFAVYCPNNGKVYLVPIEDVTTQAGCYLRVDPPLNNQRKRIRWASAYELKPVIRLTQMDDI